MNSEQRIVNALERVGIFLDDYEDDINIMDYIEDSLQFITAVLEIEQEFDTEFPDEYLLTEKFESIKGLAEEIDEFLEDSSEENDK